jgi:hypothetical protein
MARLTWCGRCRFAGVCSRLFPCVCARVCAWVFWCARSLLRVHTQAHAAARDLQAITMALEDLAKLGHVPTPDLIDAVVEAVVFAWRCSAESRDAPIECVRPSIVSLDFVIVIVRL